MSPSLLPRQYDLLAEAIDDGDSAGPMPTSFDLWFVPLATDHSQSLFRFAVISGANDPSCEASEDFEDALALAQSNRMRRVFLSDANTALRTSIEMQHQAVALRKLGFRIRQFNCVDASQSNRITAIMLGKNPS